MLASIGGRPKLRINFGDTLTSITVLPSIRKYANWYVLFENREYYSFHYENNVNDIKKNSFSTEKC